jgi:hypothetical protein
LNRVDKNGNISKASSLPYLNTNNYIFLANDSLYRIQVFYRDISVSRLYISYNVLNNLDSSILRNKIQICYDHTCINNSINSDIDFSGIIWEMVTSTYKNERNQYIISYNELTGNTNWIFTNKIYSSDIFNDFKAIDNTHFLFVKNDTELFFLNNGKLLDWNNKFSQTTMKSLLKMNPSTFVISGSKNGNCWFAIMDTAGNVLQEHTLTNRNGTFNHVALNKDGSLLFAGSLYKNSFSKTGDKIGDTPLETTNNAFYLARTKPLGINTGVQASIPKEFEINTYPNPAYDYMQFYIQSPEQYPINLSINDCFGNIMSNNTSEYQPNFRVDLQNFSSGIYFYKIQCGKYLKSGKFIVIK